MTLLLAFGIAPKHHHLPRIRLRCSSPLNLRSRRWIWPHLQLPLDPGFLHFGPGGGGIMTSSLFASSSWRHSCSEGSNDGDGDEKRSIGMLILRCVTLCVLTILSGLLALHLRGLAQAHLNAKLLPPIAALVGAQLGRAIELGNVQRISPLGITLGACSVGPHDEEFSCAEFPNVSIRIRPIRSIRRGCLTADVFLSQPQVLVCQKQDWTWLGIPNLAEKSLSRSSSQSELDHRRKIRRMSREAIMKKLADQRKLAARSSASMGYALSQSHDVDNRIQKNDGFRKSGKESVDKNSLRKKVLSRSSSQARVHFEKIDREELKEEMKDAGNVVSSFAEEKAAAVPKTVNLNFPMKPVVLHLGKHKTTAYPTKQWPSASYEDQKACSEEVLTATVASLVRTAVLRDEGFSTDLVFANSQDGTENDKTEQRRLEKMKSNEQEEKASPSSDVPFNGSFPISIESIYVSDGTLMLLGYGDHEARVLDEVRTQVKLAGNYQQVNVRVSGRPKRWRSEGGDEGHIDATVIADVAKQKWHVKVNAKDLFAPLLERLLEIPLDCSNGIVNGEVSIWMDKSDKFPSLSGRVDMNNLSFQIWESPSPFKGICGTLFLQGQRLFFHNTTGSYGSIPLSVSGDMDLIPETGEYRLSCQVSGVEVNSLMKSLNARPPLHPIAGALKAVVYCRGHLDVPIFEGSSETLKARTDLISHDASVASELVRKNIERNAVAAYDRVVFSSASANFTFDTDSCMANIYGIRVTPIGGGEIRGAGDIWICPEAESDPTAVQMECSGHVMIDDIIHTYAGSLELPPFGAMHSDTKVSGSLLQPVFDVKWVLPTAKGSFSGARGNINVCHESTAINSSGFAYDIITKIRTSYPLNDGHRNMSPVIEGVELDARMRGFDIMSLTNSTSLLPPDATHVKVSGRVKVNGHVKPLAEGASNLIGDVSLSGIKLNQLLVASNLAGTLEFSPYAFKLHTTGRGKEHLLVQTSLGSDENSNNRVRRMFLDRSLVFSLQRGLLLIDLSHTPQSAAKLEIRNLLLDELEISSLRGAVHKVDVQLNLQKRRGHGCLSARRPRFSGVHGELLDLSARWSGDVITLEKSVFEQLNSRYELQGEYVLPRRRTHASQDDSIWEKIMAGQIGSIITSLGRWRLRLEVPRAEVADMLPVARLLSRSNDPEVVYRSKELFMQEVEKAAFMANNLRQEIEYIKKINTRSLPEKESTAPLPGLAELNGRWLGTIEASGGGNSDTTANFDLHGKDWEWGAYHIQTVIATGSYFNVDGFRLEKVFLQKDNATLHADGTLLGRKSNLHFAVLNFPIELLPPLLHALNSSTFETLAVPLSGILHMEGDLRGDSGTPECDVQVRLLDGIVGGIHLGRAEVAASITALNHFLFKAVLEPVTHSGHVHVRGSIPLMSSNEESSTTGNPKHQANQWMTETDFHKHSDGSQEHLSPPDWEFQESGAVYVDSTVKDGGMMLLAAVTPQVDWLQGIADVRLQVRGTVQEPKLNGKATFHKVAISSPVLPRPIFNLGGTISVMNNELLVENVEGRVGKKGSLLMKGRLPFKLCDVQSSSDHHIELKADFLEVRAKNTFSGQVDGQICVMGSMLEPELTGSVKLSHGEVYLSQEKAAATTKSAIRNAISDTDDVKEENSEPHLPVAVRLKGLKLHFGPDLRMVYPLILNFATSGELELHGFADPIRIRPKGTLSFGNGDVNLVATQVRLNKDFPNRAKFEPEQGLDPTLDLALVGADWQLKVQGRAQNWQDSLVMTSTRSGEQDALTRIEAAKIFENQLAESLLEGDGQLAFKKLAAATVETLMPKIETKGEFGQARWRLVYAPQIPNLLSLDPTTDPFKSLANLSFGTQVEVQLGKHLQASVVRQLKESEMATQWTLIYQLNSKLRILFSSIPSVDNSLLFEYSASAQN